MLQDS